MYVYGNMDPDRAAPFLTRMPVVCGCVRSHPGAPEETASRLGVPNFRRIFYDQFLKAGMGLPGQPTGARGAEKGGRVVRSPLMLPVPLAAGTFPAAALSKN